MAGVPNSITKDSPSIGVPSQSLSRRLQCRSPSIMNVDRAHVCVAGRETPRNASSQVGSSSTRARSIGTSGPMRLWEGDNLGLMVVLSKTAFIRYLMIQYSRNINIKNLRTKTHRISYGY